MSACGKKRRPMHSCITHWCRCDEECGVADCRGVETGPRAVTTGWTRPARWDEPGSPAARPCPADRPRKGPAAIEEFLDVLRRAPGLHSAKPKPFRALSARPPTSRSSFPLATPHPPTHPRPIRLSPAQAGSNPDPRVNAGSVSVVAGLGRLARRIPQGCGIDVGCCRLVRLKKGSRHDAGWLSTFRLGSARIPR
jgi:hypothetical protein